MNLKRNRITPVSQYICTDLTHILIFHYSQYHEHTIHAFSHNKNNAKINVSNLASKHQ